MKLDVFKGINLDICDIDLDICDIDFDIFTSVNFDILFGENGDK